MKAKSATTDVAADVALMVPVSTIAHALDVTPRRVQQLAAEGVIPKAERGRYPLIPVVRAYLAHQRAAPEVGPGELDPAQERARKDRALAISAEIKNDIATGKVVLAEVAIASQVILCRKIKNKVEAIPSRAAPRGIACKTVAELHALLAREAELVLLELSDGDGLVTLDEVKAEIEAMTA
jgi:phage terminase Nu1 subunit (DNA packaging protein)